MTAISSVRPVSDQVVPRRYLAITVKLLVALALFLWMLDKGKLDPAQLSVFADSAVLPMLALGFWLVGPVFLASLRWKMLLTGAGYQIGLVRSVVLQLIGFFFTTVLPGSLGGDFIKVYYLIKENPGKSKTTALWVILFDRLIGMFGLFAVGALFISMNLVSLWEIGMLRPLIVLVYGYLIGFVLFIASLQLFKSPSPAEAVDSSLSARLVAFLTACGLYRNQTRTMVITAALSTLSQALSFMFFAALVRQMLGAVGDFSLLGVIFPVGMLITTLPLSPGGLGVGHLAFDQLFTLIKLHGGANVYNAYFVSQTLLNLTGVVAYLLNRPTRKPPLVSI
jgi:glycosyltransferase 2 family protein